MLAERDKQILRQLDTQLQTFFYDRAMEAVEAANITYDTCQKARAVDLTDNLDRNFINQWVSFYDAPDTFMRNIFEFLAPEMAPDTLDMVTKVYEREKLAECTQPVMMDKLEGPKTGILEDLKEVLFDEAEEALPDTLPDHFFDKCKKEPKMLFYFKVWFPCWIEYCEFLPSLMRKAVSGNSSALEKLIRLDPCILNHPQINIEYQRVRFKNLSLFRHLCEAQRGKGLKELSPTNIKYLFGAYIYRLHKTADRQSRRLQINTVFVLLR
jgi:hypothetical protein